MVHVIPIKGQDFNQVWIVWSFWPKVVKVAPIKEKSMNQIELTWGNEKFSFWVICPWMSIGDKKGNCVIMVKDLKMILGMVSLDIYQITIYSCYSK